jgi:GT2 family glycosyltransferase
MHFATRPRIVVLGMLTKMPVAGVVWQYVHYLIGLERLGCDVYYVEEHARTPSMFMQTEHDDGSARAAAFLDTLMRRFDLGGRWAFRALHEADRRCFGMSETQLQQLYASADFIINLHGGTIPASEHYATGRLVYLETDPVQLQIELHEQNPTTIEFLEPHCAFFTFGENLGAADCPLPVSERFPFKPTRQPVVMDFWSGNPSGPGSVFTSVGNWEQKWREVQYRGEKYTWSKHHEFMKVIDLPSRTSQPFELALASYTPEAREMVEGHGWSVRDAMSFSMDTDAYRDYVAGSRGEFTVAKDQNVRLRSGWFSDRSATYLAAGRPVITQETGFSNSLPIGRGLFSFSTMADVLAALETINGDYERSRRAARDIARDYFSSDVVLGKLLDDLGVSTGPVKAAAARPLPSGLAIVPLARRPMKLPEATVRAVLGRPVGAFAPAGTAIACPRLSVVIVTYNNLIFTRMCVESLLAGGVDVRSEIVLVDNASGDGTLEYVRQLAERNPIVRVITNQTNRGFAAATNQGLLASTGEILVLLNNDTIVPPGALPRLVQLLEDSTIGLAGPTTNRIGNEAEVETSYETYEEMIEFAQERAGVEGAQRLREIGMPAMFCLALRRDTLATIGLLDEQFGPGLFEDDDYAMRARAAGFRCVCAEHVFVHHFGEATFGPLAAAGVYGGLFAENRARFEKKWNVKWQSHARRVNDPYAELVERILRSAAAALPAGARVLVVSKGGEELLAIGHCAASHFPAAPDGSYAGYYPADSAEALAHLEELRAAGAEFLLFPSTGFWWLEHYAAFADFLRSQFPVHPVQGEDCLIYDLRTPVAEPV